MPCPWKSPWHPLTPPVRSWTQAVFATGILSTCPWYLLFVSRLLNQVNKKVLNTDLIFLYLFKWTFDKIHWEYVHGKQKVPVCSSRLWFFIFGFNCNNQQAVWSPNSLQHTNIFICTNLFQTNFVNQVWINGTRTNDVHNSNAQPPVQRILSESFGVFRSPLGCH